MDNNSAPNIPSPRPGWNFFQWKKGAAAPAKDAASTEDSSSIQDKLEFHSFKLDGALQDHCQLDNDQAEITRQILKIINDVNQQTRQKLANLGQRVKDSEASLGSKMDSLHGMMQTMITRISSQRPGTRSVEPSQCLLPTQSCSEHPEANNQDKDKPLPSFVVQPWQKGSSPTRGYSPSENGQNNPPFYTSVEHPIQLEKRRADESPEDFLRSFYAAFKDSLIPMDKIDQQLRALLARDRIASRFIDPIDQSMWLGLRALCEDSSFSITEALAEAKIEVEPHVHAKYGLALINAARENFEAVREKDRASIPDYVAQMLVEALEPYVPGITSETLEWTQMLERGELRQLGKIIEYKLRGYLKKKPKNAIRKVVKTDSEDKGELVNTFEQDGSINRNTNSTAMAFHQGMVLQKIKNMNNEIKEMKQELEMANCPSQSDRNYKPQERLSLDHIYKNKAERSPKWKNVQKSEWGNKRNKENQNFVRKCDIVNSTYKFETDSAHKFDVNKTMTERRQKQKLQKEQQEKLKETYQALGTKIMETNTQDLTLSNRQKVRTIAETANRLRGKSTASRMYKLLKPLDAQERALANKYLHKFGWQGWTKADTAEKKATISRSRACAKLVRRADREQKSISQLDPPISSRNPDQANQPRLLDTSPPPSPKEHPVKEKPRSRPNPIKRGERLGLRKLRPTGHNNNPTYQIVAGEQTGESLHQATIRKVELECHQPELFLAPQVDPETTKDEKEMPGLPDQVSTIIMDLKGPDPRDDTGKTCHTGRNSYIPAVIAGAPASCLYDTGASINTVPRKFVEKWDLSGKVYHGSPLRLSTATGTITLTERINLRIMFQKWVLKTVFYVSADENDQDVIIGTAITNPGPPDQLWVVQPSGQRSDLQIASMGNKPITHLFRDKHEALKAARWLARGNLDEQTRLPLHVERDSDGGARITANRTYWKTLAGTRWIIESTDGSEMYIVDGDRLREGVEINATPGPWGQACPLITNDAKVDLGLETDAAVEPVQANLSGDKPLLRKVRKDNIPATTIVHHKPTKEELQAVEEARKKRQQKHDERGKEAFLKPFQDVDPSLKDKAPLVWEVVWEFRDVFGETINDCKEGFLNYKVDLGYTTDDLPKPRFANQGPVKKAALKRYLEVYEKAGIVSRTRNEAYSNAFLIKKPGHIAEGQDEMNDETFAKQWRLICDLSAVNNNISTYATEPQTIASILEQYKPHELQCSVDILACFHQVNLADKCKPVTTFAGAGHNWWMNKLPMGGVNSVNVLQAILDEIFKDLGTDIKSFLVYVDDLILTAKSPEDMAARLRDLLQRCRDENVVLKWTKSVLLRKEDIKILGFSISKNKLMPQKEKLEAVEVKLKNLKTQKELRAMLASLNYYRCFTHRFSYMAQPLHALTLLDKKDFRLSSEHLQMLHQLVEEIKTSPGLNFLNDARIKNGSYRIYADASTSAMGGLITATADGIEYPLSFHSKSFPDEYRIKHINILETLAFNMMVRKFKGYTCGRRVTLVTDSQYFKRVMDLQHDKQQLLPTNVLRWITEIRQECQPKEVILVKSEDNPADFLTRFTEQGQVTPLDTPFFPAGFDVNGQYEPGFAENPVEEHCAPDHLDLVTGHAPTLALMAQTLQEDTKAFRAKFFEFVRQKFAQRKDNMVKLYGKPKTKDADTFIRTISAKDWNLGHPELELLSEMTGIKIIMMDEDSTQEAGCKFERVYGGENSDREMRIFRTITGQVSLINGLSQHRPLHGQPLQTIEVANLRQPERRGRPKRLLVGTHNINALPDNLINVQIGTGTNAGTSTTTSAVTPNQGQTSTAMEVVETTWPDAGRELMVDSTFEADIDATEQELTEENANPQGKAESMVPMAADVKKWQNEDETFQIVINALSKGKREEAKRILEEKMQKRRTVTERYLSNCFPDLDITTNGILVIRGYKADTPTTKFVVPPARAEEMTKRLHEHFGHPGRDRTAFITAQYISAPGLTTAAARCVRRCDNCAKATDGQRNNETPSAPNLAVSPWESLSIDVMHLPPAAGYHYALIASDNASAYTWAIPLRRADATTIVKALDEKIFLQHGAYLEVNFDGATQLNGKAMTSILDLLDTVSRKVLVGRKDSNRAERDIGRIRQALRKAVEDQPNKWLEQLPHLMLLLNATPIVGWKTDMSPYEIQFGHRPRIVESADDYTKRNLIDFIRQRADKQEKAQAKLAEQRDKLYRQSTRRNPYRRPQEIKVGDLVLTRRDLIVTGAAPTENKVKRIYSGPHQVIERDGNHYVVSIAGKGMKYHRRRLKLHVGEKAR